MQLFNIPIFRKNLKKKLKNEIKFEINRFNKWKICSNSIEFQYNRESV